MLYFLEFVVACLFIGFYITQVLIPLFKNRPLFPSFRRLPFARQLSQAKAKLEETDVQQVVIDIATEAQEAAIEAEIAAVRLRKMKTKKEENPHDA